MKNDVDLAGKAAKFQKILEEKIVQHHGMVPMLIWPESYQLPTEDDYAGSYAHRHLRGKTEAEIGIAPKHVWRAWENTTSNTSFYLGVLSSQYRCTRDPGILNLCGRTLRGLEYIYNLGIENGRPGFMCKPYGGVYSTQSSGDQIQCVVAGLASYLDIAPKEDYDIIRKIVTGMSDYLLERDFVLPDGSYFASEFDDAKIKMQRSRWSYGLIYIPLMYLAWYVSGDERYIRGINWWHGLLVDRAPKLLEKAMKDSSIVYTVRSCKEVYLASLTMRMDPLKHDLWRQIILDYYKTYAAGIADNGMHHVSWTHDFRTGKTTPAPSFADGYITQTGRSALFARGCVDAQQWFKDGDMAETAYGIISKLDLDQFRFVASVPGEEPLPKSWQIEEKLLDLDSMVSWLWTYWEGKWFGYWQ